MTQERYPARRIAAERRQQYRSEPIPGESPYLRADDLRRNLMLKYALHPDNYGKEGIEPRNMWSEIAIDLIDKLGTTSDKLGVDMGTSSGYLPDVMLGLGYEGGILGLDIEAQHLDIVADRLQFKYPGAKLWFGKGNAESLRYVQFANGERLKVRGNTFDWTTQLNIHHHTPDAERAINTAAWVTKRGGLVAFMDRAVGHLGNMYEIGELVAEEFDAVPPRPWYEEFDFFDLEGALIDHPQLEVIASPRPQAEYVWIPDTDEGWKDYINPFYLLVPLMKSKATGARLKRKKVEKFVEEEIRNKYFKRHASYEDGYFTDYIFQRYFVCQVVK